MIWLWRVCLIVPMLVPNTVLAEVEIFALTGWPVYQRQTAVNHASHFAVPQTRFRDFGPQQNLTLGAGTAWWLGEHLGLRGDFMIYHPNLPQDIVIPGKGWRQRIVAGTISVLARVRLTERVSPYGGIGLARTAAKQCDSMGCTPNTMSWGGTATIGVHYQVWQQLGLFIEARHLSTTFRYANERDGAFASDVHITSVQAGVTWQIW